jgi:hypothetical protein
VPFKTLYGTGHELVPVVFHITNDCAPFVAVQQPLAEVHVIADAELIKNNERINTGIRYFIYCMFHQDYLLDLYIIFIYCNFL